MNCPKCNNVVEQGSSFCTSCGFNLNSNSNNLQEQPVMVNTNQAQSVSSVPSPEPTLINSVPVGFSQGIQPSVPVQNINPVNNFEQSSQPTMPMNNMNQNNQPVMPTNNMNNMNFASAGNGVAAAKANSNASIIIIVVVIAFVAIGICYFMTTKNASSTKSGTSSTSEDTTVAVSSNSVTVNGLSGNVPKNWSFVAGDEIGAYGYGSIFINDSQSSYSVIETSDEATYALVKQNVVSFKANLEAKGLTDLNYEIDKKNGNEYILFEGLYQNVNYHIVVRANGAGVICAEGGYASASDLNTIVDFVTSLKKSTGVRAMSDFTSPNFNSVILGK